MKCPICKQGETQPGVATVTLERKGSTIVVQRVPADVCDNCGEQYVSTETTSRVLQQADAAVRSGVTVEVRQYLAA